MTNTCRDFQAALEAALVGGARAVGALGWHEHLLGCGVCRALLAAEEALDELLASLPEPRLDERARERVLARLARERGAPADELDRLLDGLPAAAPRGLSARVLAGLHGERADVALDELLGRWRAAPAPAGLAERTLVRLTLARRAPARRRLALQVAAALLVALGLGAGWRALRAPPGTTPKAPDPLVENAPPQELLEALDLLESWDLLTDPALEVALSGIDEADEILLENEGDRDPQPVEPSKG